MGITLDQLADGFGYDLDELDGEADALRATWTETVCPWGWCVIYLDPAGRIASGTGPMLCPCDHSPGWSANRVEQMGKPRVPVKARGRHGSRVQRSARRHRLDCLGYARDWTFLPPRSRSE